MMYSFDRNFKCLVGDRCHRSDCIERCAYHGEQDKPRNEGSPLRDASIPAGIHKIIEYVVKQAVGVCLDIQHPSNTVEQRNVFVGILIEKVGVLAELLDPHYTR